ncbi:MAG: type VI secretion system protein VasD [Moritella sp.]|jgi:type VI secretion system protein VasD
MFKHMKTVTPSLRFSLQGMKATATAVLLVLLSACSSTDVRMNLSASADLNTNSFSEPLPVIVRIYQLADVDTFQSATFDQLWKADELVLGSNLLHKQELMIKPNAKLDYEFVQMDNASYVAIFALFREIDKNGWRWVHKLDSGSLSFDTEFDVKLVKNQILYMEK